MHWTAGRRSMNGITSTCSCSPDHCNAVSAHAKKCQRQRPSGLDLMQRPLVNEPHCSMARVVEEFTVLPATHAFSLEWNDPLPSQLKLSSFTDPGGMKGWVGLGTTMSVSSLRRTATWQPLFATQTVTPHWETGAQGLSVELVTSLATNRDADLWPLR